MYLITVAQAVWVRVVQLATPCCAFLMYIHTPNVQRKRATRSQSMVTMTLIHQTLITLGAKFNRWKTKMYSWKIAKLLLSAFTKLSLLCFREDNITLQLRGGNNCWQLRLLLFLTLAIHPTARKIFSHKILTSSKKQLLIHKCRASSEPTTLEVPTCLVRNLLMYVLVTVVNLVLGCHLVAWSLNPKSRLLYWRFYFRA